MNIKPQGDVGVIVGRFQVPQLHEAHIELIQSVVDQHSKVLIILGLSPLKTTLVNPLDLEMRRQVIAAHFPNVQVAYVKDVPSDTLWSQKLDEVIQDHLLPNQTAVLYGGRDSFIPFYSGKFPSVELEPKRYVSGTEIRNSISKKVMASVEFRSGVIWATANQFPVAYPTVDVAIVNNKSNEVLLARKPNEQAYRFVGGFALPDSDNFEQDGKREVLEETGLEVGDLTYIGSTKVDDWRYRKEAAKIKTLFFLAYYVFGAPKANDDIAEVFWCPIKTLDLVIVKEHEPLVFMLWKKLGINK